MSNLPQAFYAGRVTEALRSVAHYLKEAQEIGNDVKPLSTVGGKVTPSAIPLNPKLTGLNPPGALWDERSENFQLDVNGKDLNESEWFGLIPADDLSIKDYFVEVKYPKNEKFTVFLGIKNAPAGKYHALVKDKNGVDTLFPNAFIIAPEIVPPQAQEPPSDLQLGAIFPNISINSIKIPALLVVLRGKPSTFSITDTNGMEQQSWSVSKLKENDVSKKFPDQAIGLIANARSLKHLYPKAEVVFLSIDISNLDVGSNGEMFYFVAKSNNPQGEDRLAFFVVPNGSDEGGARNG